MDNIKDGLNKFLSSGDQDGGDADPVKNEMGAGNEQQSGDQEGGDQEATTEQTGGYRRRRR